jgi:hypothetical protein
MFALNLNGIFVLTMFKKSYFPEWGSLPLTLLQRTCQVESLQFDNTDENYQHDTSSISTQPLDWY